MHVIVAHPSPAATSSDPRSTSYELVHKRSFTHEPARTRAHAHVTQTEAPQNSRICRLASGRRKGPREVVADGARRRGAGGRGAEGGGGGVSTLAQRTVLLQRIWPPPSSSAPVKPKMWRMPFTTCPLAGLQNWLGFVAGAANPNVWRERCALPAPPSYARTDARAHGRFFFLAQHVQACGGLGHRQSPPNTRPGSGVRQHGLSSL